MIPKDFDVLRSITDALKDIDGLTLTYEFVSDHQESGGELIVEIRQDDDYLGDLRFAVRYGDLLGVSIDAHEFGDSDAFDRLYQMMSKVVEKSTSPEV